MQPQTAEGFVGGRYRVDGQLGQGGMARVFDAFDERLERRVAVKILHPETEAVPGMRKRFQQEARIVAQLIHPHIVAVLDYGEDGESCYLVMERLPGRTLRDEMAAGPLPPERVALVTAETLSALAAAHRYGVLHRDIKPSNILLQEDGHIKLTDFGIAKSFDLHNDVPDDVTQTGIVLGTPGYLAPERRAGQAATVRSDVYSVGAVMVEALSGQRPGLDAADLRSVPADLRVVASRGALAPDPRDRFVSAEAMLNALKEAESATPAASLAAATVAMAPVDGTVPIDATSEDPARTAALFAPPVVPPPVPRHRIPRRTALLAGGVAAALLLVIIAVLSTSGGPPSGPSASATSHHTSAPRDPERTAIRSLATSVSSGGLPGDPALASALQTTASEPPGAARQAAATQALALGAVLLAGGGISNAQYQDVISILQPTGATVPTTTTTTTAAPAPKPKGPGGHHGPGGDQG